MTRHSTALHGPALAAALLLSFPALAAEPAGRAAAKPGIKNDAARDAMAAEMARYATPGPAHSKLRPMEGKWKTVTKAWYAPGEPTVSEGTAECRLILDGRYLEQRFVSTMLGQPFEGYGLTGYDNRKGVYTWTWIDNATTSLMTGEGTMDGAGSELTLKGTGNGPDGKPTSVRMVTRILDGSRHVFSMYSILDGQEQLMMEITYTRM